MDLHVNNKTVIQQIFGTNCGTELNSSTNGASYECCAGDFCIKTRATGVVSSGMLSDPFCEIGASNSIGCDLG